jgi:hypothetical protein
MEVYGPFWTADLQTHLSGGEFQVVEVVCDGGRLRRRLWLTDTARERVRADRAAVIVPAVAPERVGVDGGSEAPVNDELGVLAGMAAKLEAMTPAGRARVLDYLVARYHHQQRATASARTALVPGRTAAATVVPDDLTLPMDIRSFRELKAPSNAQEMAAVLAFYLAETVPEDERREIINPADIEKYFKQAGFPLPARSRNALFNAKAAGYLEEATTRGEYKLSPVGYNLVKHRLPRSGDRSGSSSPIRRKPRRAPSQAHTPADGADLNATS